MTIGANFSQVAGSGTPADCTASFSLTPGATCNLSIAFTPKASGALTGAAVLTDNALNGSPATQSIALSGTGVALTQTITFAPIANQVQGTPLMLSAAASSSSDSQLHFSDAGSLLGFGYGGHAAHAWNLQHPGFPAGQCAIRRGGPSHSKLHRDSGGQLNYYAHPSNRSRLPRLAWRGYSPTAIGAGLQWESDVELLRRPHWNSMRGSSANRQSERIGLRCLRSLVPREDHTRHLHHYLHRCLRLADQQHDRQVHGQVANQGNGAGDVFLADYGNDRVVEVTPSGVQTTVPPRSSSWIATTTACWSWQSRSSTPMTVHFIQGKALAISGIFFPANAAPGSYAITFTGASGSLTDSTTAKFTVE